MMSPEAIKALREQLDNASTAVNVMEGAAAKYNQRGKAVESAEQALETAQAALDECVAETEAAIEALRAMPTALAEAIETALTAPADAQPA